MQLTTDELPQLVVSLDRHRHMEAASCPGAPQRLPAAGAGALVAKVKSRLSLGG
ncbi:hypothetical protein ABZ349_03675 [Streptomyces niveus]|uniref:hypothetical protein n=1 Tax=Streptomyces niveus TaxID=193462 RepID=UPI0033F0470D